MAAPAQPCERRTTICTLLLWFCFDSLLLPTQLKAFSWNFRIELEEVEWDKITFLSRCIPGQLEVMSRVSKLVRLLLAVPATKAMSKKSFSGMQHIGMYLRSMISQQHLNHLKLLHIHKKPHFVCVAREFVAGNDHRRHVFGTELKSLGLIPIYTV